MLPMALTVLSEKHGQCEQRGDISALCSHPEVHPDRWVKRNLKPMRNKTLLFLAGALLSGIAHAQLQRIVLQGSGAPQVFTDINAALAAAQPNDKVYLSGGVFNSPAHLVINMPLHFIGAGVHPDSTGVTSTTTLTTANTTLDIIITTAASGSSFTGIRFNALGYFYFGNDATDDDPTGLIFHRCVFDDRVYMTRNPAVSGSSAVFDECIFYGLISAGDGVSGTFTRCIVDVSLGTGAEVSGFGSGGLTMRHCTCFGARVGNSPNAIVEDCVFTRTTAPFWQSNGATLTNNLCVSTALTSNMTAGPAIGNVLGAVPADLFVNETNDDYEFTDDVHLTASSPGIGMATDGTEVGIYGTNSPYKPGAVPYNPHFRSATIATSTNANGELPVSIRVAAQPN